MIGTQHLATLFLLCIITTHAIPVILDTDIGDDMDDSWALADILQSPEIDVKLVLTAAHNAKARAQIVAKYLTIVGRTDLPVGVGIVQDEYIGPMGGWASDYDVSTYAGEFYDDGIQAAIDIIGNSTETITIIAIAPMGNIGRILQLQPSFSSRINVIAMSGSVLKCYGGSPGPCPEYNVYENVNASQISYNATWAMPMVTTPIDTSGFAYVNGTDYQNLLSANNSQNLLVQTLLECYVYWHQNGGGATYDPYTTSTTLYDPVAVYLTFSNRSFVNMVDYHLVVNNKGETIIDAAGQPVTVALTWARGGEEDWALLLVQRLLSYKS